MNDSRIGSLRCCEGLEGAYCTPVSHCSYFSVQSIISNINQMLITDDPNELMFSNHSRYRRHGCVGVIGSCACRRASFTVHHCTLTLASPCLPFGRMTSTNQCGSASTPIGKRAPATVCVMSPFGRNKHFASRMRWRGTVYELNPIVHDLNPKLHDRIHSFAAHTLLLPTRFCSEDQCVRM